MKPPACFRPLRLALAPLAAFALWLGALATPAVAAPSFEASIDNDANEVQSVLVNASAGQFRLVFGSGADVAETANIPVGASAEVVQSALNALANVSAGGGSVGVRQFGKSGAFEYYVSFSGGPLAHADVPLMHAIAGTVPLTGGGATPPIQVSTYQTAAIHRSDERVDYTTTVGNAGPDPTAGPVTLEVELPGGLGTSVFEASGNGWSCQASPAVGAQPARATCTRSNALAPGASYPPLAVAAALGADAPDPAIVTATVSGGGALSPASATSQLSIEPALPFGAMAFDAAILNPDASPFSQAGGHPFIAKANFALNKKRVLNRFNKLESAKYLPVEYDKDVVVDVPPGFVGNVRALPKLCPSVEQLVFPSACPPDTAVGGLSVIFSGTGALRPTIYAIKPEHGLPAQFAFPAPPNLVFTFAPHLRAGDGYAISFASAPNPEGIPFLLATPELCGFGAKVKPGSTEFVGCKKPGEAGANPLPLMTNPTLCGSSPPIATLRLDSWAHPGATNPDGSPDLSDPNWKSTSFPNPPVTGCDKVKFEPTSEIQPTSHRADSPTGLEVGLSLPANGLEGKDDEGNPDPEAVAQANLRTAKVTFPEGMAVNPTAGQGLGACTAAQAKLGTNLPIECPESSKVGTVEIETPVLEDTLTGNVYIAKQGAVGGALIGLYLVFDSPENGLLIKVPARVDFDPQTGQLATTVEDSPQQPFSAVRIRFAQGPRSPLLTPPKCGHYEIEAQLTPWTGGAPVSERSGFDVTEGPGGGPCPSGGLSASFEAGSANPLAAQTTPFNIRLHRPDGTDRFNALSLSLPPGLTAYLKGIPYCSDATLASIPNAPGTGQAEIDHPFCPQASQLGKVIVGAGAGESPLYVDTAKAYLAGPYKGAPLSIAVVAPAVAGPLDLGNVVIRNALYLNPATAQVRAVSDPIPTILHGILLDIRDVRVQIDRPAFTLNPTNCDPMSVGATLGGLSGQSASLSSRFQVGGCESLGFKPTLKTRLFGGTGRGAFPAFRATYEPRAGDANLKDLALRFPRSEFIEQGHFRTICTRVQYAANSCPAGSIYGHVSAITPLLADPLEGPVYLRSSDHNLPDVVFALHGQVDAEAVVRIDSKQGGLRASIEGAPDVPITKVTLDMQGGQKGLFVNSRDLCASTFRSSLRASAHNGAPFESRPALANGKCGKKAKRRRARGGPAKRSAARNP